MPALSALTLTWLSATAFAAIGRDCLKTYKPEYETEWAVTAADWEDGCRQGHDDRDLLRYLLANSVEICFRRNRKAVESGKVHETTVRGYCAQGAAGRERLAGLTGIPYKDAPKLPDAPAAPPAKKGLPPKDFGLGPLVGALEESRDWQPDSCLARLSYYWEDTGPKTEEGTAYHFYSKKRWKETFTKIAGGPPGESHAKGTPNQCVTDVEVDLPTALELAEKAGLKLGAAKAVTADLLHMTADIARSNRGWSKKVLKKTFWAIAMKTAASGRALTVVLDAQSGKLLHKQSSALVLNTVAAEAPKP